MFPSPARPTASGGLVSACVRAPCPVRSFRSLPAVRLRTLARLSSSLPAAVPRLRGQRLVVRVLSPRPPLRRAVERLRPRRLRVSGLKASAAVYVFAGLGTNMKTREVLLRL